MAIDSSMYTNGGFDPLAFQMNLQRQMSGFDRLQGLAQPGARAFEGGGFMGGVSPQQAMQQPMSGAPQSAIFGSTDRVAPTQQQPGNPYMRAPASVPGVGQFQGLDFNQRVAQPQQQGPGIAPPQDARLLGYGR